MKDKNIENKVSASSENLRGTPQSAQRTEKPLKVRKNWLRIFGIILCAAALTLGIVFGVGNIFKTEDNFKIYAANEQAAADWTKAVGDSLADSTDAVYKVTLQADWGAEGGSFGTGTGYTNGALYIPAGAKIELDLNGHALSRNLSSARANGYVIYVSGEFTLSDSSGTQLGIVTGGYNSSGSSAGGVHVAANSTFNFEGGNISNNTCSGGVGGGGIYTVAGSTMNMGPGAKISSNTSTSTVTTHSSPGGIVTYGTFNSTGGTITGNTGVQAGAAKLMAKIAINNLTVTDNVSTGSNNNGYSNGGIITDYDTEGTIENCTITGNRGLKDTNSGCGGVGLWNKKLITLKNCLIYILNVI